MNLLLVGATGVVGRNLVKLIENSDLDIENIYFVASSKNVGKTTFFKNKQYVILDFFSVDLSKIDICCMTTNENVSAKLTPILLKNNITVIDNSSHFRNTNKITIGEINFTKNEKLYINPNCCVIQSILAIYPISKKYPIDTIIYNTYQSQSGGGNTLLTDFTNKDIEDYKCLPKIGSFFKFDNSGEENKLINETKKLLNNHINVVANCCRVPVYYGHLVNIIITFDHKIYCDKILNILQTNTIYVEDIDSVDITNNCNVYTTRLKHIDDYTISFYTYANNVLRGASYNSFVILQKLLDN